MVGARYAMVGHQYDTVCRSMPQYAAYHSAQVVRELLRTSRTPYCKVLRKLNLRQRGTKSGSFLMVSRLKT